MEIKFGLAPQDLKVLKNALKDYAVGKGKKTQFICEDLLGIINRQEKEQKNGKNQHNAQHCASDIRNETSNTLG